MQQTRTGPLSQLWTIKMAPWKIMNDNDLVEFDRIVAEIEERNPKVVDNL